MCSTKELPCPLCNYPIFSSVESLRISLVNVTSRQLICPVCNDTIFGLDKLTIHLFGHTIVSSSLETNESSIMANTTKTHLKAVRRQKSVKNDVKQELSPLPSAKSPSPLSAILKCETKEVMSSPSVLEPECDICGCSFRTNDLHQMHMKLVHEIPINIPSNSVSPVKRLTEVGGNFQCHLCSKTLKMKGSLRVHLRVVHSIGSKIGKPRSSASNTENSIVALPPSVKDLNVKNNILSMSLNGIETMDSSSDASENKIQNLTGLLDTKIWECDVCSKSFTTKYFLKKHKRLHTGEMPYTCEICGKTFTFQQSYHKHLLYHNDDKPHSCQTCGRAFKELSTLHNHERIHSGEKPFKCETCDKCFRQRVSYLVHRRIHTGVMPYKCTACEKTFRYKVSQRTHKCEVQPPGTVIRQKSDLLSKLLQQNVEHSEQSIIDHSTVIKLSPDNSINQTLDELVEESCNKMGIGCNLTSEEIGIPTSPSENFKNLCLYTTESECFTDTPNISTDIVANDEISFKELFYDNILQ